MKTKIVFSVVSGENDIYLPQAMVAAYTARKNNPTANIVLVVDEDTGKVVNTKLPNIKKYVSEILVVEVPYDFNKMHKSRFLKTTLRQNIVGDYLFIDTDTVITCDLSDIDNQYADVAAVLDRHARFGEHEHIKEILSDIAPLSLNINDINDKYFNSGVMYVKDTVKARDLYKKWYDIWIESLNLTRGIDQPPLAKANMQCGYPIVELDGTWNCQLSDNFINFLSEAKILHYFASNKQSPYLLYDRCIFEEVMKNGDIPIWLTKVLDEPKSFFKPHHLLVYGEDIDFMRSYVLKFFKFHPLIYKVIELFSKIYLTKKL